jgi:hypothetical protein
MTINKPTFVGIDPAFRASGFAIAIEDGAGELSFKIFKNGFEGFFFWLLNDRPDNCFIGVENSNLQNSTFITSGTRAELAKRSRDVGKNQAVSQMVVDLCRTIIGPERVAEFSPAQKGKKITSLKLFEAILREKRYKGVYNYKGQKLEQDKRDAFKILELTKQKLRYK